MCCFKGFLNVLKSTEVSQHYTQGKNKQLLLHLSLLPQISVPGHQSGDRAVGWWGIKESITLLVLMDTIKDVSCVPGAKSTSVPETKPQRKTLQHLPFEEK